MNSILFLFLVIAILLTITLTPTIIKFIRANNQGANISFSKSILMSMRKTLKNDLIKASALSEKLNLGIEIEHLEAQFLAGGSPLKCIQAIEYAKKKGITLNFQIVSATDLAGKDLKKAIEKTNEIAELEFTESRIRNSNLKLIDYTYSCMFKTTFAGVCFSNFDKEKIILEIKSKINGLIENSVLTESTVLENIVKRSILDEKYWESKGLTLVEQKIITN